MLRRVDGDHVVYHAKPVFAVGGTVSGYGSLGSAESLNTAANDKLVTARDNSEKMQSMPPQRSAFKSSFAKELHQENIQRNSPSWRNSSYRSSFIDEVISEDSVVETTDKETDLEDEYVRVRRENEILKRRLSEHNKEDEKYKKLEFEIEQLTWQLGKVKNQFLMKRDWRVRDSNLTPI